MADDGAVACLYFGYDLDALPNGPDWMFPDNDEYPDFDRELARRLGWVEVSQPLGPDWSVPASISELQAAQRAYEASAAFVRWERSEQEMRDLVRQCPVELIFYGEVDDPRFAVLVVASVQQVEGYKCISVHTPLSVGSSWNDELNKFMDLMELPIPESGPGWYLCNTEPPE